jgi:hypothetical protein
MGDTHVGKMVVSEGLAYGTAASSINIFTAAYVGSVTWDPGSIADGNEEAQDVTVTGAALGDFVLVSHTSDLADTILSGSVTAANTVTAVIANNTGGAIDVLTGTLTAIVLSRS